MGLRELEERMLASQQEYRLADLWRGNKCQAFVDSRSESHRQYRAKWIDVPKRFEVLAFPMHLSVATNEICNLQCRCVTEP